MKDRLEPRELKKGWRQKMKKITHERALQIAVEEEQLVRAGESERIRKEVKQLPF